LPDCQIAIDKAEPDPDLFHIYLTTANVQGLLDRRHRCHRIHKRLPDCQIARLPACQIAKWSVRNTEVLCCRCSRESAPASELAASLLTPQSGGLFEEAAVRLCFRCSRGVRDQQGHHDPNPRP